MKLRHTLSLFIRRSFVAGGFALLTAPALLAQEGDIYPGEPEPPPESTSPYDAMYEVEQKPEFPGGVEAMFAYIAKELKYPEKAMEQGIKGVVLLEIVVERDGSHDTVGPKVVRAVGGGCTEEALRVVRGMPKWKPAMHYGQVVRAYYYVPVRFALPEKQER